MFEKELASAAYLHIIQTLIQAANRVVTKEPYLEFIPQNRDELREACRELHRSTVIADRDVFEPLARFRPPRPRDAFAIETHTITAPPLDIFLVQYASIAEW